MASAKEDLPERRVRRAVGGRNSDKEFVRLRGRLSVEDPQERARRQAEFEAYRAKLRIQEYEAQIERERQRMLAASASGDGGEAAKAS
jgi:hypothetical protein